jgi:hypothetical protein
MTFLPLALALVLTLATEAEVRAQPTPTRNPKAAAFLSMLVPGLGELYAGGHKSSRFFLFTEATFWTGLATFKHLESSREDNFKAFAAEHAGLDTADKSDTFIDDVGIYNSIYARNARERFVAGDAAEFIEETPVNIWEWNSDASRRQFRELRSKSTSARQKSMLFVGALLFNRFASSINAAHIARKTQPRAVQVGAAPDVFRGGAYGFIHARF